MGSSRPIWPLSQRFMQMLLSPAAEPQSWGMALGRATKTVTASSNFACHPIRSLSILSGSGASASVSLTGIRSLGHGAGQSSSLQSTVASGPFAQMFAAQAVLGSQASHQQRRHAVGASQLRQASTTTVKAPRSKASTSQLVAKGKDSTASKGKPTAKKAVADKKPAGKVGRPPKPVSRSPYAAVKRPLSAYNFFVKENFAQVKVAMPEAKTPAIMTSLAQQFKALGTEAKAKYQATATSDKQNSQAKREEIKAKIASTRVRNAFLRFHKEQYSYVAAPGMTVPEVARKLGEQWRGMDESAKAPYEAAVTEERKAKGLPPPKATKQRAAA